MTKNNPLASALAAIPRRAAGLVLLCFATSAAALAADPALPRLQVSDNGRFLVTADGKPFFWLGDTAWHMFGKSARDDNGKQPSARLYFSNRAAKGFTVIQSVIVRSPEGGSMANAYGFEPFENGDWSQPRLRPGANDDYWDHIDWCLAEAKQQGLRMAALPCWLDAVTDDNPMVRDARVAYRFGHFLGARYGREPHLIWVLGGDAWQKGRNVNTPSRLALVRAMAEGLADGATGVDRFDGQADWHNTLMTFHPPGGGHSSAEWLHAEPWLDFNMIQTTTRFAFQNWETVAKDYARQPPKPTFDAEVAYEGSLSLRKTEPQDRRISPWDVRRAAYWDVFAGGCGHTYGHRSFIGWIRKGETYRFGAHIPWYESLDAPGAFQMGHLRRLIESLPDPLQRVPDQSLLASEAGTGNEHIAVTRDVQGRYALVYSAAGKPFTVKLEILAGDKLRGAWFDPREGTHRLLSEIARRGTREFRPPTQGEGQDWILVLNDASRNFQLPSLRHAERAARGPLRVHPENPRYFTDGSGKAIYLTGSHTWNNFQHNGVYPAVSHDEYLLPTGMNDPQEPTWGGWAGRYGPNEEHPGKPYFWANQKDAWRGTTSRDNTLARWAADLQNDFRARMDWCVKPRGGANHRPNAVLNGRNGGEVLRLEAKPRSVVELDAHGSSDPDGDAITYEWFVYGEAGTYRGEVSLNAANGPTTGFTAPEVQRAETVHVLLRLKDDGDPPLCAYRRAVVTASP